MSQDKYSRVIRAACKLHNFLVDNWEQNIELEEETQKNSTSLNSCTCYFKDLLVDAKGEGCSSSNKTKVQKLGQTCSVIWQHNLRKQIYYAIIIARKSPYQNQSLLPANFLLELIVCTFLYLDSLFLLPYKVPILFINFIFEFYFYL